MKIQFTKNGLITNLPELLFSVTVLLVITILSGCSSGIEQNSIVKNNINQKDYEGDKSFSFKDYGSDWRVDFNGQDISALYENGTRIPDNEIEHHKKMIYENLNELKSDDKDFKERTYHFHFDADRLNEKMNRFKENFEKDSLKHFRFKVDNEDFQKLMEELKKNLNELKNNDFNQYFDDEKFKDLMKELQKEFKSMPKPPMKNDIEVYLDMNDFKDDLENFAENFKPFDFKYDSAFFDIGQLKEDLNELKEDLKELKSEVGDLNSRIKQ